MAEKRTASQVGKSNVATSKAHERRVAKLLSQWAGVDFRRRRVEGRGEDTIVVESTGDVIPTRGLCRFNLEAKKGKGFSLDAIMNIDTIATNKFTEWWHQSNYDARLATEARDECILPFMFFKPHTNWDWVAFPFEALSWLEPSDAYEADERPHKVAVSSNIVDEPWFPCFAIDAYAKCGLISHNVKHTSKKENMEFVPLQLHPCYITRWRTFAENVKPESFFI